MPAKVAAGGYPSVSLKLEALGYVPSHPSDTSNLHPASPSRGGGSIPASWSKTFSHGAPATTSLTWSGKTATSSSSSSTSTRRSASVADSQTASSSSRLKTSTTRLSRTTTVTTG